MNEMSGKAGRTRWMGVRPTARGMTMNPVDHPNGGGEGKSKSGGGRQHLKSPWGLSLIHIFQHVHAAFPAQSQIRQNQVRRFFLQEGGSLGEIGGGVPVSYTHLPVLQSRRSGARRYRPYP